MERTSRLPAIGLRHVAWAVLIYCGLVAALWPRRTYDLWWHLATGRLIVEQRAIPDADPFTYTREGEPWITHEWGWEVPMYLMYARWGHAGLMVLRVLGAVLASAMLAWLCLRRGAAPLAAMAVGALAIFAARPLFNDRPQAVSIPLFVATLCLIEQTEQRRERWLLLVPLLMIPWVNLHGGFIYGPGLLALYGLSKLPSWYMQRRAQGRLEPPPVVVAGALALACVACLINPHGVSGATYPLGYIFGPHSWHKTVISEYQSPDFSQPIFFYFGWLIVAMTAVFAASGRRSRLWDVLLSAALLYTALQWQRNMALFAFAVAPPLSLHVSDLLERAGLTSLSREEGARQPSLLYAAILLILLGAAVAAIPAAHRRTEATFSRDLPLECTRYVQRTGLQGRMYNTYRWGGYLIWHLWPEHKVFVDGRADVMGRELVQDWRTAHKLNEGWEDVLERYEIDWAIVSVSAPIARALDLHPDWRRVCEEPTAKLFVRAGSVADQSASE